MSLATMPGADDGGTDPQRLCARRQRDAGARRRRARDHRGAPSARRRLLRDHRAHRAARWRANVVAAGAAGVQAVLELTDYAPLPLREPVRSLVWIRGRLHQVPAPAVREMLDLVAAEDPNPALLQVGSEYTLLRLEIESVVVADATGAESVGCRSAAGSPARSVLRDGDLLVAPHRRRPPRRGRPAGIQTARPAAPRPGPARSAWTATGCGCGSRARTATTTSGCRSCKPGRRRTGLSQAIRILMGCPFVNGLRARRF